MARNGRLLQLAIALLMAAVFASCSSASTDSADAATPTSEEPATETHITDDPDSLEARFAAAMAEFEVPCETLPPWSTGVDVLVWASETASAAELEQIKEELRMSDLVQTFLFVDQDATFAEFLEFTADTPSVSEGMGPADMPTRFEISTWDTSTSSAAILRREYEGREIVDTATTMPETCAAPDADADALCAEFELASTAIIFVQPQANQADIDRIAALIADADLFDSVKFSSQEDARSAFPDVIGDLDLDDELMQDLLSDTGASDLPASFEIEVVPGTDQELLLDSLRTDPDVFQVVYFAGGCVFGAD